MRIAKHVALLVAVTLAGALSSQADILTFETDQTGYSGPGGHISGVASTYGGFVWDEMVLLNTAIFANQLSGLVNGTVSGDYVAYNSFGKDSTMTFMNANGFDFVGAYVGAGWSTGLTVQVDGYRNGNLVGTQSIVVDTTGATWWQVDFLNIDALEFSAIGGSNAGLGGTGNHFSLDNFTYNLSAQTTFANVPTNNPVPEPATMTLLGLGLAGLVARSRKQNITA